MGQEHLAGACSDAGTVSIEHRAKLRKKCRDSDQS